MTKQVDWAVFNIHLKQQQQLIVFKKKKKKKDTSDKDCYHAKISVISHCSFYTTVHKQPVELLSRNWFPYLN